MSSIKMQYSLLLEVHVTYIYVCIRQCQRGKVVALTSSARCGFNLGLSSDHAILVANADVHDAHVGRQEVDQAIGASARQAIEGIAHGLAIGIEAIAHAAVAGSIAAAAHQLLIDLERENRGFQFSCPLRWS